MKVNKALWMDQSQITMPYVRDYYDGPLEGLIEYKGETFYFVQFRWQIRPKPKSLYCAYRPPAEVMAGLKREAAGGEIEADPVAVFDVKGKRKFEIVGIFHG